MARDGVPVSPEFAALVARYVEGERFNVRAKCAEIGSSKSKFYKYAARFAEQGVDGLYPETRRPRSSPTAVTVDVEDLVVLARKLLHDGGWDAGADSIGFQLQAWAEGLEDGTERGGEQVCGLVAPQPWPSGAVIPSRATINRILQRRGQLIAVPQRRPRKSRRRFEAQQPNTRWQMDGFEVALGDGTPVCVLHIVDDCSRMDIALRAVPSENSADVWSVFQDAAARYGLPAQLLTDNGTAFSGFRRGWVSALTENLTALGTGHITSSIKHPQTCGKCERAHRTCRLWLSMRPSFATIEDLNTALDNYRCLHNNSRRRRHLHNMTPAQRYRLGPLDGPIGRASGPVSIMTKPVAPNGTIAIDRTSIGIGRAHAGTSVSVIRQAQRITVIGHERLITEIDLKRGLRYQSANPNGRKVSAKS
ncbi:DDE-type integrase/transposase/recombinase [Nocardioides psychrotolerans]|uniref:DDE-type integrase/transposase/recombinase n=1 Tax=Nocardioides psychrotolerans TaxID=1005945 RepID=UPI003137A420